MRCGSGSIPTSSPAIQLMPGDVVTAITAQNTEVAAGEIGAQPSGPTPVCSTRPSPRSRACRRPSSSATSSSRPSPTASTVRLSDVARIELGAESYSSDQPGQRPSRRRHRGQPRARRRRAEHRRTGQGEDRSRVARASRRAINYSFRQRFDRLHQTVDQRGREDADRGDRPRRHRDVRVPAELARDADPDDRGAGRAARHVRRLLARRLSRSTR